MSFGLLSIIALAISIPILLTTQTIKTKEQKTKQEIDTLKYLKINQSLDNINRWLDNDNLKEYYNLDATNNRQEGAKKHFLIQESWQLVDLLKDFKNYLNTYKQALVNVIVNNHFKKILDKINQLINNHNKKYFYIWHRINSNWELKTQKYTTLPKYHKEVKKLLETIKNKILSIKKQLTND